MKADRPLILSVLLLAAGVGLILAYCHGTTNLSAAYPFSGSTLHVDFTTVGPAVLGGILMTALGVLLMVVALLAAVVGEIGRLLHSDRPTERLLE
jgi:hypothetical protein